MIYYGQEWLSLDSYFQFKEISAPGTPPADELRVYAKDKAGTSALYLKDDAGSEREIGPANQVTGTGTANRLAYWTSSSVLGANAALTQGQVVFPDSDGLLTGSANLTIDASTGTFNVRGTGASQGIYMERNNGQANFAGFHVNGSATVANQFLAFFGGGGSHTGLTANRAITSLVGFYGAETWGSGAKGSYLTLETTPTGSTTRAERFRVGPSGQWGIGGATYGSVGNLFQSGGASAAPSWLDHTTDFLSQYALLAGRSGGQTVIGGTASSNKLTLQSTSNATRGDLDLDGADLTFKSTMRARMLSQYRFRYLNSSVSARQDSAQTLPNATSTALTLNAEDFDTDGLHDNSTDNSRVTIALTGKYLVTGIVTFVANATGDRFAEIRKDGTTILLSAGPMVPSASLATRSLVSGIVTLTAGSYLELIGYQSSGGDLDTSVGADHVKSRLMVAYLGE